MSEQKTIKSYVLHKYGHLISAGTPLYDAKTKKWSAEIKSNYPISLQDDRSPNNVLLRFIQIKNIGTVRFDNNLSLLVNESTSREECADTVKCLLDTWRERTERIVVKASANNLVQIPEFRHYFTPIDELISLLLENDFVSTKDIAQYASPEKQIKNIKYLKLLEAMKFIRKKNEGFVSTEDFWLLRKRFEQKKCAKGPYEFREEEFRKAIISEVIRNNYTALLQVFKINRLEPTIHVDSCIYRPAIEAGNTICFSIDSIAERYRNYYGPISNMTLVNILRKLKNVGAIEREKEYWCGNHKLLSDMLELKNSLPILAPPVC